MSGKSYTEEFKIEAVKQVTDRGYSVLDVAVRILVIPITCSGFIRSPDLPNAMDPIVSL